MICKHTLRLHFDSVNNHKPEYTQGFLIKSHLYDSETENKPWRGDSLCRICRWKSLDIPSSVQGRSSFWLSHINASLDNIKTPSFMHGVKVRNRTLTLHHSHSYTSPNSNPETQTHAIPGNQETRVARYAAQKSPHYRNSIKLHTPVLSLKLFPLLLNHYNYP